MELVGRDRERAEVSALLADGRAVVLDGEAGIGKTTLLRAVAADSGRPVFEGGGLSTLSWIDGLPLRRALGRPPVGGDATAMAKDVRTSVGSGVLIIDDLQWCDATTIGVLAELAGQGRLLTGVRRDDAAAADVLELVREAGFAVLELAPLTEVEARKLVTESQPRMTRAQVDRVVHRAAGNPLLLTELAASGEPTGSLRLALAAKLRRLDSAGRDAFRILALAGHPLSRTAVGDAGADKLLQFGLAVPDEAGVAVRHALLAELAVDELDDSELAELHGRIAHLVPDRGEAARHFERAGDRGAAYEAAVQAAATTPRPGERARHLALAARCATGPEADERRMEAARALSDANDWSGIEEVLAQLESPDPQVRGWAALLRAKSAFAGGRGDQVAALVAEGLAAVAGSDTEIEVLLRIEQCRVPIFVESDFQVGIEMARAAADLAVSSGVEPARALYFLGSGLHKAGLDGWREPLGKAIEGARRAGDLLTELASSNNLISFESESGDPAEAYAEIGRATERARELGHGLWVNRFRIMQLSVDWHLGKYHEALELADDLLRESSDARASETLVIARGMSMVDLGRIEEATTYVETALRELSDDDFGRAPLLWVLSEAALLGGRPAKALELVASFLDAQQDESDEPFALVTRAWAMHELGRDPGRAAARDAVPMVAAVHDETEGVRLLHCDEPLAAAEHLEQAARLWAPYHRRGELRALWAAGEALRRAGSRDEAVARLQDVEARAVELGMGPLAGRIRRSLRAAGVRRAAARGPGSRLTGREREVLELVAAGLTNDQIAARLGLTRRTVETQLASATAKLGATSRVQAAAMGNEEAR